MSVRPQELVVSLKSKEEMIDALIKILCRYTCEECIEGLEWVQAYLLDPVMIAEFTIYLEQNVCIEEWEGCKEEVAKYFAPMHLMAMEK